MGTVPHTRVFGGSVVEVTDQCLMKVAFLSVCGQTDVKGKAIWHAAPADIWGRFSDM